MKTEWVYGMAKFNVSVDTLGSGRYMGGGRGGHAPPLEAHIPTLLLQKSVESKAGKTRF